MGKLKLKIIWLEWDPISGDDVEYSVVSDQYYPEEKYFEESFCKFVSSLEEKYNVTLDGGGDSAFQEYTIADDVHEGQTEDVANNLLQEMVSELNKSSV